MTCEEQAKDVAGVSFPWRRARDFGGMDHMISSPSAQQESDETEGTGRSEDLATGQAAGERASIRPRRRATPVPELRDDRYYDSDQPGMGDTVAGGDASKAPRSLREPERRAKKGAILAGDDWDNPEEI